MRQSEPVNFFSFRGRMESLIHPEKGRLYPNNVVTTHAVRLCGPLAEECLEMNLPAISLVLHGKYGRGVFPAVVSKARIPIRGVEATLPPPSFTYPLQKKRKSSEKLSSSRRSQRLKSQLQQEEHAVSQQFLTATDSHFKSGENVVTGGTSVTANLLMAYQYIRRLSHDLNIDLRVCNLEVQNIVCSANLGYELNPEWIAQHADREMLEVFYWPQEFVGLTWITEEEGIKIVFVVFESGKVVATGLKSEMHIPVAEKRMHRLIGPFRKVRINKCMKGKRTMDSKQQY